MGSREMNLGVGKSGYVHTLPNDRYEGHMILHMRPLALASRYVHACTVYMAIFFRNIFLAPISV